MRARDFIVLALATVPCDRDVRVGANDLAKRHKKPQKTTVGMPSASCDAMTKWFALLFGVILGVSLGLTVRVEPAHACEPTCPPDESVVLEVREVSGSAEAETFWRDLRVRDAVVTPHYLLFAVGDGQVELEYRP